MSQSGGRDSWLVKDASVSGTLCMETLGAVDHATR
jgi:hypothetical protein